MRLTLLLIGGVIGLGILFEFASEQPVIAASIAVLLIVVPVGRWYQHRKQASRFHVQHLRQLLTATSSEFEDVVRDLFSALGDRDMQRVGGCGDLGVDLTGIGPNSLRVVVQCKRYGRGQKVGSPAIQTLMGAVVNRGVDKGVFVTTSTFTALAIQAANSGRVAIDLIDGDALTRLAQRARTITE